MFVQYSRYEYVQRRTCFYPTQKSKHLKDPLDMLVRVGSLILFQDLLVRNIFSISLLVI